MKKIETLCQMLEEKTEYFREYEDATEKLLSVDVEEMENQMNRRQKLIVKIDYLDAKLREAAQSLGERGDDAWRAVRLEKGKSEIPQELWPVFEKAQEACAVANRIRRKEPLVVDRIEEELEGLSKKIRETNRSVSAKAARFASAFSVGLGSGPERSKRI